VLTVERESPAGTGVHLFAIGQHVGDAAVGPLLSFGPLLEMETFVPSRLFSQRVSNINRLRGSFVEDLAFTLYGYGGTVSSPLGALLRGVFLTPSSR
jgi:hypothetical protein